MKNQIKNIVRRLGIWHPVQKLYAHLLFLPYAKRQTWDMHVAGITVVYDTSDAYSRHWFYPRYGGKRLHEPITTKIFTDYIQPQDVVLDIGAHLGYFTCLAATLAPQGRVYAFDTDLKSCQLIEKNAKQNALQNIHICHSAVSNQAGVITIKNLEDPNPGLVINAGVGANSIEVPCMRIDDFIAEQQLQPNFIKIDIEGAEALALSGMENTLQIADLTLLVEIHVNHLQKYFKTDYKALIAVLLKHHFKIENIDHRLADSTFETVHADTVLEGNTMLLCTKNAL